MMTAIPAGAYQAYRTTQIQTASPAELILLLYDGAIKYCKQAQLHLENGEKELAHNALIRSQDIIDELAVSLDFSASEEIAKGLAQLYDYMGQRLIEANIKKDKAPIAEVVAMLEELRETWSEAAKLAQRRGS
jgi:flagellar protein FliS